MSAFLTYGNPKGPRLAQVSISGGDLSIVVIALIVIVIAWIMAEAQKLQHEQEYTV